MGGVVRWFVGLRGASLASHLRNPPTLAVLPAGIGLAVPHAIVPVVVSAVVAGLVTVITKYLVLYAKNRRARSIAAIRKAAMEKKITVPEAVRLIQADMPLGSDSQQLEEGAAPGGDGRSGDSAPKPSARERVAFALRRLHLW